MWAGVGAIDVEGRVGLGEAPALGLGKSRLVTLVLLTHAGEDEIAGAVENALEGENLVGRQALHQGGDDGHAAGNGGLEGNGSTMFASGVEDFPAMNGKQRLVGRHDVLARRQQGQHRLAGPVDAADQLGDDLDGRIAQDLLQIGGEQVARQRDGPLLVDVAHDDPPQLQASAGPGGQAVGLLEQQASHATADSSAAEQGYAQGFLRDDHSRPAFPHSCCVR